MYIRFMGEGSSVASCSCSELSPLACRSLCLRDRDRIMKKMLARIKPSPSPRPTTRPVIIPTFELDLPAEPTALLVALVAASVSVIF